MAGGEKVGTGQDLKLYLILHTTTTECNTVNTWLVFGTTFVTHIKTFTRPHTLYTLVILMHTLYSQKEQVRMTCWPTTPKGKTCFELL